MFKIKYLVTGNTFELPDNEAQELRDKYPDEYKIIEKNGKKFTDKVRKNKTDDRSVYSKVVEGEYNA